MVIFDGKKLSAKILEEVKEDISKIPGQMRLGVVMVGDNPVVQKFVEQKKKVAERIGIGIRIFSFPEGSTTNELRKRVAEIIHEKKNRGVIVQLPLPSHINTQYILNSVVPEKDVDVLSARSLGNFIVGKSPIIPPVAGAVKAFLEEYEISLDGKNIVVAGIGNLVGRPVALWLLREKATFSIISKYTPNAVSFIKNADIIISGTGSPNFIKGDMIKDGAIILDAGTSETEGKLVGDAEFESASKKASFLTPVPGGIGPLTIAILFRNLVALAKK